MPLLMKPSCVLGRIEILEVRAQDAARHQDADRSGIDLKGVRRAITEDREHVKAACKVGGRRESYAETHLLLLPTGKVMGYA